MAKRRVILPQECWELIFNRVDGLEAISLVCKEFLSISNSVRHSLKVYNLTVLCRLLKRFPHLKKIDLSVFDGDIDLAILEIARSGLNLEALNVSNQKILPVESLRVLGSYMKSLKTLECGNLDLLRDCDLQAISDSFPWLEELDISSPSASVQLVTDDGIEVLASKLRALSKINVSWNTNLSDRSILALSSNCVFLREIIALYCYITENCIALLFRRNPNLLSLSVSYLDMGPSKPSPSASSFTIENSIAYAKALCALDISYTVISDSLLSSIAKAHIPLKKLALCGCQDFSFSGLSLLLQAYPSLEELDLQNIRFLTDDDMSDLSQYLHDVTYIDLSWCPMLTDLTFYILSRNCPSLEKIEMKGTSLGAYDDLGKDFQRNHRIQYLNLTHNNYLRDGSLKKIGLICPSLRILNVTNCSHITAEGIEEIFKTCKEIRSIRPY